MIEDPDMDEEPDKSEVVGNVDQDGQGDGVDSESNEGPNVRSIYLTRPSHC